jgi:hypothetical protein
MVVTVPSNGMVLIEAFARSSAVPAVDMLIFEGCVAD